MKTLKDRILLVDDIVPITTGEITAILANALIHIKE